MSWLLPLLFACSTPPQKAGSDDRLSHLEALGYVDGTVDEDGADGVVLHDTEHAFQGYSFYASRKQSGAQLLDMQGRVLHTWKGPRTKGWQHVTLLPNGDVLVLVKDSHLFKIDKDSKLLWTFKGQVHHDLDVDEDGTIYVLSRKIDRRKPYGNAGVLFDYVQVLSADGQPLRQIPVFEALDRSPYAFLISHAEASWPVLFGPKPSRRKPFDPLHVNHVEVLDGSLADVNPAFRKGSLLLSARSTHAVFVLDPSSGAVDWVWGPGVLLYPHHPTVTDAGTVLIFNNGVDSTKSQLVELDPSTNDIVWTYGPNDHFYSEFRGGNQRLPNGNTLITESDTGYVFEVTKAGKTVWEFHNPHRKTGNVRMAIWRMNRFASDDLSFPFNAD